MADVAGGGEKYRLENLGDDDFQRLVQVLVDKASGGTARCLPLNQSDGGVDVANGRGDIFQVKFTTSAPQNKSAWLEGILRGESKNFDRLIADEGMTSYYLVTNVEGSATPVKGDRAKIDKVLEEFHAKYKIQFYVWWRAEVQVKTANLDWSTKLAFGQMLTGPELLTYHEAGVRLHETERAFNSVLRGIAATQYQRDRTLKFRHDEAVDGKRLDDLFVDVEMRVIPGSSTRFPPIAEGGACRWLLDDDEEKAVLLRGAPGQGKSTLLQYACQVYRAAFLNDTDSFPHPRGVAGEPSTKRFAVRLDLRDYASWMTNQSRREKESSSEPRRNRKLKSFLTQHLEHTVDDQITREHIDRLFREIPVFLALDGLDEVGDPEVRRLVVEEVEAAAAELAATPWKSVIVVTTRPSYGQLAEPSGPLFTGVQLQPLSPKLTKEYIGKWASVSRKTEEDLATILSEFEERAREPYFTALTQNPMQLTCRFHQVRA